MHRWKRTGLAAIAVLASMGALASAQDASIELTKTVGTVPNECATSNVLDPVPPDGKVYYCYKITYTGGITASCHTVTDTVLGDVLHEIPGGKCCTDATATNCEVPTRVCSVGGNACFNAPYQTCAATTYPGVCCSSLPGEEGKCPIPHLPCEENANCPGISQRCVINPLVAPGTMVTRVITATVPASGVTNIVNWSTFTGICCDDTTATCNGLALTRPCCSDGDCSNGQTCHTQGVGLCCMPDDPNSCTLISACLQGRDECPDPFSNCVVKDATAADIAAAQVGPGNNAPVLSAVGLAFAVLALVGIGLAFLREREPQSN